MWNMLGLRPARGSALAITLGFTSILAVLMIVMVRAAQTEGRGTDAMHMDIQAGYLAEGAAEYAITQLKNQVANRYPMPVGNGPSLLVLSGSVTGFEPPAANAPAKPVAQWKVFCIETARTPATGADLIQHTKQRYAVTGRGYYPDPSNPNRFGEVYVNKVIDLDKIALFDYLAFYNKYDLEIMPGAAAALTGRIFSNRDIYLGAESGASLSLNASSLGCAGALFRHRKDRVPTDSNYYMTGTVQARCAGNDASPVYAPFEARGALKTPGGTVVPTSVAPSGYDSNFIGYDGNGDGKISGSTDLASFADGLTTKFGGNVMTGYQGNMTLAVPTDLAAFRAPMYGETANYKLDSTSKTWVPATPATGATSVKGYYQSLAALVISSNGTTTQIANGTGTVLITMTSGTVTSNQLKNAPTGGSAVVPLAEKQMFDQREYDSVTDAATQGMVKLTELDLGKLNTAYYGGAPVFPTTGTTVLYAYRTDTTSVNPYGFRLTNGVTANGNLTFVTEDPIYVKGDFNTNAKKIVLLLGDSVNFLSNEWNDANKTKNSSSLPDPGSNLTINAGLMCGGYGTTPGCYNGGLENFIRYHEDWQGAGKTVNFTGCMVSLFNSTYAQGLWVGTGGNRYTPPQRNYLYDNSFLALVSYGPDVPFSVGETRVVWWTGRRSAWWP